MTVARMGERSSSVAVFYSCGRESRKGGSGGVWGTTWLVSIDINYGVIWEELTALQLEYRGWKEVLACRSESE